MLFFICFTIKLFFFFEYTCIQLWTIEKKKKCEYPEYTIFVYIIFVIIMSKKLLNKMHTYILNNVLYVSLFYICTNPPSLIETNIHSVIWLIINRRVCSAKFTDCYLLINTKSIIMEHMKHK